MTNKTNKPARAARLNRYYVQIDLRLDGLTPNALALIDRGKVQTSYARVIDAENKPAAIDALRRDVIAATQWALGNVPAEKRASFYPEQWRVTACYRQSYTKSVSAPTTGKNARKRAARKSATPPAAPVRSNKGTQTTASGKPRK